jgi:hypothetical protein
MDTKRKTKDPCMHAEINNNKKKCILQADENRKESKRMRKEEKLLLRLMMMPFVKFFPPCRKSGNLCPVY